MPKDPDGREWVEATVEDGWLRPAAVGERREPRWGHPDGIQLGLHPLSGPRGLIRVFTPYLGHPRERLVNFIAIEPIPVGERERGYSELETSRLDGVPGLRFWSADDPADATPRASEQPARGVVRIVDGVSRLDVNILFEPFANGTEGWVTASFRADRPHEFSLAPFTRDGSVALDACVLSATMGNWARLRDLELVDRTVRAADLWPEYHASGFAEHAAFGVDLLRREGDEVSVSAAPDEADPASAVYADGTKEHWRYVGARAVQTWRAAQPDERLVAQVNGRHTYWMSEHPIPGGIAFENFELVEPFRQGRQVTFQVEPLAAR